MGINSETFVDTSSENKEQNIIGFNDDSKTRFNLCIDKKTDRLLKVIQISYHKIYGDGSDEVIYEYAKPLDLQPSKLIYKEHGILESILMFQKKMIEKFVNQRI